MGDLGVLAQLNARARIVDIVLCDVADGAALNPPLEIGRVARAVNKSLNP